MRRSGQISRARQRLASTAETWTTTGSKVTRVPDQGPVFNIPLIPPRVAAYVVRRLGEGIELLVFDLEGFPEMGTQVPAGGIRSKESRKEAALRKVKEETGLVAVRVVTELGIIESPHPASGRARQTSYWVLEGAEGMPSEWRHAVASDDDDADIVFLCRWESLPMDVALVDQQGSLLSQLVLRLG